MPEKKADPNLLPGAERQIIKADYLRYKAMGLGVRSQGEGKSAQYFLTPSPRCTRSQSRSAMTEAALAALKQRQASGVLAKAVSSPPAEATPEREADRPGTMGETPPDNA